MDGLRLARENKRCKKTPEGVFDAGRPRTGRGLQQVQAMKTAMKASRNIKTAPPIGKTIGIKGTMDSTTSVVSV
jgi:hypothetical protein